MCRELTVKRDSDDSQPVIQTPIENAGNGCPGFRETCQGTDAGKFSKKFYSTYSGILNNCLLK